MKKIYQTPSMEVITIQTACMLANSLDITNDEQSNDNALSRGDDWDED